MKYFKICIYALFIGILLECSVFNFDYWNKTFRRNEMQVELDVETAALINWECSGASPVSREDAHIIWADLSNYVADLSIHYSVDRLPGFLCIYYNTEDANDVAQAVEFGIDTQLDGTVTFAIGDEISMLRVDLGNQPGIVLNSLYVTLNPRAFSFSISRVVAIVLIAVLAEFLFSLQKMPDYKLDDK